MRAAKRVITARALAAKVASELNLTADPALFDEVLLRAQPLRASLIRTRKGDQCHMALIFIAADDHDGYVSNTAETDVFVKTGVLLGVQFAALQLLATDHDVTVQGAIVGRNYGIDMGLRASNETGCDALRGDGETPPF